MRWRECSCFSLSVGSPFLLLVRVHTAEWSTERVIQWLSDVHFPQYADLFRDNDIDGCALMNLDKSDLEQLGIASIGHRASLTLGIDSLKNQNGQPSINKRVKKIAIEGLSAFWGLLLFFHVLIRFFRPCGCQEISQQGSLPSCPC